jgi:hypothetical protein
MSNNLVEHARAWSPLKPTTHGRYRIGGPVRHHRRHHSRHLRRYPRRPVYVVAEPSYESSPHWWYRYYPTSWVSRWYYEGFQNESKMNCSMLATLTILLVIVSCLKYKK